MAEVLAVLGTIGSQAMAAASTAGSFLAANAGTIGTALSVGSTIYGGLAGYTQAKGTAANMKKKGDQELAVAQREAERKRRETQLLISRQTAVAGASGAGATDPTVLSVMGKTQAAGDEAAMLDMYNGMVNRSDLRSQAGSVKSEGRSKLFGSFLDAGGTIYSDFAKRRREQSTYSGPNIYSIA